MVVFGGCRSIVRGVDYRCLALWETMSVTIRQFMTVRQTGIF